VNNSIRVSAVYSFRGETFSPTVVIDLDALVDQGEAADFHALLARQTGIDTYSYVFEVLQQATLQFSEAHGLAAAYLHDGRFDFTGFAAALRQQRIMPQLQAIAADVLALDDLNEHPSIREALLQAYLLGTRA
jgi:hypothetical protein